MGSGESVLFQRLTWLKAEGFLHLLTGLYGTECVERDASSSNLPWNEWALRSRVHLLKRVDAVLYIASKYAFLVRIVNCSRYLIARALKTSQLIPPILIHLTLDHEGRITIKLTNSLFDILLTLLLTLHLTEEQSTISISQFYLVINSLVHC